MVTEKEFMAYEGVREYGVTNMLNVRVVQQISGLCREKVLEIMDNYSKFRAAYLQAGKD